MAAPSEEIVDFTSPNFDALAALYNEDTNLSCPESTPFDSVAQYTAFMQRAAVRKGLKTQSQTGPGSGSMKTKKDGTESDTGTVSLGSIPVSHGEPVSYSVDPKKPLPSLTPDELATMASLININETRANLKESTPALCAKHETDSGSSSIKDGITKSSVRLVEVPWKKRRNVLSRMEECSGPLSVLYRSVSEKLLVKVWTRSYNHVRGFCKGYIVAFDKHWNLAMSDVDEVYRKPQKPPRRQRRGGKRPWIGKKTIGADKMHQDTGVDNKIPHAEPDKTLSTPSKDQTVVSEVLVSSHSKDITESEGAEQTAETDRNLDESEPGESDVEKTSTVHKIEKGDSEHGEEEEDIEALKMKLDQLKEMLLELEDSSDSSGVSSDSCDEREKKQDKCGQASPRSEKAEESRTTNQNATEASQKEERRKSSTHKSGREHKRDDRGVTGHKDFSPKRKIDDKYNKEVKSSDEKSKMSVKRSAQPQDCDHSRSRSRAVKGETSNRSKSVSSSDRSSRTMSRHSSSDSYRKSSSSRDKSSYYKSDSHGYHKKSSRYHREHEKPKTHYQLKDKKSRETDSRSDDRKKYGSIHRSRDSSHTSQKQTFVRQSESEDEFKEKSVLKGKDDKAQDGKLQVDEPSSASRDPVICHRHVNQLFIRGDNIVMVAIMK